MKAPKSIEKSRPDLAVNRPRPNIVEPGITDSIRGRVSVAALVVLGGLGAYYSLRSDSTKSQQPITEKSPTNGLFSPASIDKTISKEQIPAILAKKLGNLGEVIRAPEAFDSSKPNLYLIANQHLAEDMTPELEAVVYETQENVLKIFHVLYSLGTEIQFIEGQPVGYQLEHDKPDPRVGDHPYEALDKYKKTGKIGYVSSAIEGIYGNKVYSVGIDDPEKFIETTKKYNEAIRVHLAAAQSEIYPAISKELGINELPKTTKEIDTHIKKMRAASMKLTERQKKEMVDKYLLGNAHYWALLEATTEFSYYRIPGRNMLFSETMNELASSQKDATFIVGQSHLPGLIDKVKGWNVFVIQPRSIKDTSLANTQAYARLQTKEDYRAHILEHDQFVFGLSDKDND